MLRTSELEALNEQLLDEFASTTIERKLKKLDRKLWNKTNNELGRKHYEH